MQDFANKEEDRISEPPVLPEWKMYTELLRILVFHIQFLFLIPDSRAVYDLIFYAIHITHHQISYLLSLVLLICHLTCLSLS